MSIRRIESAYAHCLDKKISGTDMSVLIALSYCANSTTEKCIPGQTYLAGLTHLSENAVANACKRLRDTHKLITWESGGKRGGGNVSNRYFFEFPICQMPNREERYRRMNEDALKLAFGGLPPPPRGGGPTPRDGGPTPRGGVPSPTRWGTLPHQMGSNTEDNSEAILKTNTESKTEYKGVAYCKTIGDAFSMKNFSLESFTRGQQESDLVNQIMATCGVRDEHNRNTIAKYCRFIGHHDMVELFLAFKSEVRQGEHKNAESLIKVFMSRLKAWCQAKHIEVT